MRVVDVLMPKWGDTMQAGVIVQWRVTEGQLVIEGNPLVTIETDKASAEVEAPASGVLVQILAAEGEEVAVGDAIARISTD